MGTTRREGLGRVWRWGARGTAAFAAALAGCGGAPTPPPAATPTAFVDVAAEAGIRHVHGKPELDPRVSNIMPWLTSVGAAVAAGDYDRDGWVDLYVTDSRQGQPNRLYRNLGDGTYDEVAAAAGVAAVNGSDGLAMDCIWADLDDDGWLDLYLVRWGRDLIFRNERDGTFVDVTAAWIPGGTPWANGNAVVAFDHDRDGRLDLYVGNYFREVDLTRLETTRIMHDSFETARNAGANFLYHQQPDGTFREVAAALGVADTGWTLAVGSADVTNDGWPDLYVANDFGPDRLFVNDGAGGFVDASDVAIGQDTRKGMNVDFGDFNDDGWLDIYVTNITTAEYLREGNMLWRNNGPGPDGLPRFMDVAPETHTYNGGWGWGAKFVDHDNDGDLDLFSVNGFISAGEGSYWYDLASWSVLGKDPAEALNWPAIGERSFSGHEPDRFWRNDGFESFVEEARPLGLASELDGRGIACLDHDNDGDVDLYVANQGQPPHLFKNRMRAGHALFVTLVGDAAVGTADAIGARVTAVVAGRTAIRERDGGNGYAGQSDARLHFGLGPHAGAERVEVRWPDGGVQVLEPVPADRIVVIRQDPAQYVAAPRGAARLPDRREAVVVAPAPPRDAVDPAELERLLVAFEAELAAPGGFRHRVAFAYRRRCADHDRHDRAIAFFERLAGERPADGGVQLELSVAYIDKIPTCGGLAAIVCKGTLARRSLDVLDRLVAADGAWWGARYARGMNHLHWPRALRHSSQAAGDFRAALALQQAGRGAPWVGDDRVWVLLGDALAKNGEYGAARQAWREGLGDYPASRALAERLAVEADAELLSHVEARRSLEQPIDTDLSFMDRE
jgi:hypothetical protein